MRDRLVLDTNIFNRALDGTLDQSLFDKYLIVVTHIQHDELSNTADSFRRSALLKLFSEIVDEFVPTSGAVFDVSKFDQCKYGDTSRYNSMIKRLKELDKKPNKKL